MGGGCRQASTDVTYFAASVSRFSGATSNDAPQVYHIQCYTLCEVWDPLGFCLLRLNCLWRTHAMRAATAATKTHCANCKQATHTKACTCLHQQTALWTPHSTMDTTKTIEACQCKQAVHLLNSIKRHPLTGKPGNNCSAHSIIACLLLTNS